MQAFSCWMVSVQLKVIILGFTERNYSTRQDHFLDHRQLRNKSYPYQGLHNQH